MILELLLLNNRKLYSENIASITPQKTDYQPIKNHFKKIFNKT